MKLTHITPPLHEPVTTDELKAYLKLSSDDEDFLLPSLIASARAHVESVTGRSLLKQAWQMEIKPPYPQISPLVMVKRHELEICLPKPPLIEVQSVETSGKPIPFTVVENTVQLSGAFWNQELKITYWAGYGETAEALPPDLKGGVLMAIRILYEGGEIELPLLQPYKVYRLT